jgi:hypothetical protein
LPVVGPVRIERFAAPPTTMGTIGKAVRVDRDGSPLRHQQRAAGGHPTGDHL